jgi:hypothetical protein
MTWSTTDRQRCAVLADEGDGHLVAPEPAGDDLGPRRAAQDVRERAHGFGAGRVAVALVEGAHPTDVRQQDREGGLGLAQVGELLVEHADVEEPGDRILGDRPFLGTGALTLDLGTGGPDEPDPWQDEGAHDEPDGLTAAEPERQVDHAVADGRGPGHGHGGPDPAGQARPPAPAARRARRSSRPR